MIEINSLLNITVRVTNVSRAEIAELRSAIADISKQASISTAGIKGFGASLDESLNKLNAFGRNLSSLGRSLTYTLTLPLGLAAAAGVSFADKQLTALASLTQAYNGFGLTAAKTASDLSSLDKIAEILSDTYGVAKDQVLDVMTQYAKAGAQGAALAQDTLNTIQLVTLGAGDTKTVTEGLISIQQQYGFTAQQTAQAGQDLAVAAQHSAIKITDYESAIQKAGGANIVAGVSFDQLIALIAGITPAAGDAEKAGGALQTIMSRLLVPTKAAIQVLGLMGINVQGAGWESLTGAQRIAVLADSFEHLTSVQQATVSQVVGSRFQISSFADLMKAIVDPTSQYAQVLGALNDKTAVAKSYNQQLQTVLESSPEAWKILRTQAENMLAQVIIPLMPALLQLGSMFVGLIRDFADLSPNMQKIIILGLGIVALTGPLFQYLGALARMPKALFDIGKFGGSAFGWTLDAITNIGKLAYRFAAWVVDMIFGQDTVTANSTAAAEAQVTVQSAAATETAAAWDAAYASMFAALAGLTAESEAVVTAGLDVTLANMQAALAGFAATGPEAIAAAAAAAAAEAEAATAAAAEVELAWEQERVAMAAQTAAEMEAMWAAYTASQEYEAATIAEAWVASAMTIIETEDLVAANMAEAWVAAAEAVVASQGMSDIAIEMTAVKAQLAAAEGAAAAAVMAEAWVAAAEAEIAAADAVAAANQIAAAEATAAWELSFVGIEEETATMVATEAGLLGSGLAAVGTFIAGVGEAMAGTAAAILGLFGPDEVILIVAAVAALAGTIYLTFGSVRDFVNQFASWFVNTFEDAVGALPRIFEAAISGVIQVLESSIGEVIDLLSYLNPFAHHSPSLVEQVQDGVAVIGDHYGGLTDTGGVYDNAVSAHEDFLNATDATSGARGLNPTTIAKNQANLSANPVALTAYNEEVAAMRQLVVQMALVDDAYSKQNDVVNNLKEGIDNLTSRITAEDSTLKTLQQTAAGTKVQLDAASTALSNLGNYGISGMQAMSDQIFNNEMAQKRLNLAILQMGNGNSIDQLTTKLANLQGLVETFRGNAESLRLGGAGSDVLDPILAAANGYEQQRSGLVGTQEGAAKLSQQLATLQNQGQVLALQNSIMFDPLTRQLDQAKSDMKELPFDQLLAATQAEKQKVEELTSVYKTQTDAVTTQQAVVDGLTASRDALQAKYDTEKSNLDDLKNAYEGMDSLLKSMQTDASSAASAAQAALTQQAQDFQAGADAPSALATPTLPNFDTDTLQQQIDAWEKQVKKNFGNFNPFSGLDPFKGLKNAFGDAVDWLKTHGPMILLTAVSALGVGIYTALRNGVGKSILNFFSGLAGDVLPILRGFGSAVGGVFSTIKSIVMPIVTTIGSAIGGVFTTLWGIVGPPLTAIYDFIHTYLVPIFQTWILLLIIPFVAAVKTVWAVLNTLRTFVSNDLGPTLAWFWHNILEPLAGFIKDVVVGAFRDVLMPVLRVVWGFLKEDLGPAVAWLWHNILEPFGGFVKDVLVHVLRDVLMPVFTALDAIWRTVIGPSVTWLWHEVFEPFLDWLGPIVESVLGGVGDVFEGIWDGITSGIEAGINFAIDAFDTFARFLNGIAGDLGIDFRISIIPEVSGKGNSQAPLHRASGGTIGDGFITAGPRAIVGEGNPNYPEFVIPTDPSYRSRALGLYAQLGGQLMANGGIIGNIVGDITSISRDVLADVTGLGLGAAKDVADTLIDLAPVPIVGGIAKGALSHIVTGIETLIRGKHSANNPAAPADVAGAVALGKQMAAARGWTGNEWDALYNLWQQESGWNPNAVNPSSGAAGIPQALGHGNVFALGDAGAQIAWGLDYISQRYGDPLNAWGHEKQYNWYASGGTLPFNIFDSGGMLPTGFSMAFNGTGKPEPVMANSSKATTLVFNGDLSFPNITSPDNAKKLIRNLEALA